MSARAWLAGNIWLGRTQLQRAQRHRAQRLFARRHVWLDRHLASLASGLAGSGRRGEAGAKLSAASLTGLCIHLHGTASAHSVLHCESFLVGRVVLHDEPVHESDSAARLIEIVKSLCQ